jgi:hypothetical protein
MDGGSAQASGQAWQGDRLLQAVADRLSRSATIALLVSPIGLLFVSAARLLIISDYNPATASAIVSSGGYVDALLGTVLPLIPLVLPYLALLLLFFNRVILGLLALLATALVSPTTPAAEKLVDMNWGNVNSTVFVLIGLALAFALLVTLVGAGFGIMMRIMAAALCVALIPTFAQLYPLPATNSYYTQLLRQPWLPAETFTLSTGQRFTGYALADDGTWIEILNNASRTIAYYQASEITDRQICELRPVQATQPLITLSSARTGASTPTCPMSRAAAPSGPAPKATASGGVG